MLRETISCFVLLFTITVYFCKHTILGMMHVPADEKTQKLETIKLETIQEKLVIIGSGPAGLTAAIYAAQAGLKPLVITGKNLGGQLAKTALVANWPGREAISGSDLMDSLIAHAEHAGATLLSDEVISVDFSKRPFTIKTKDNKTIITQAVIVAIGATPKTLRIPGEADYWGRGISTCAICDGMFYKNKKIVVIGGGNNAAETALFLTNFTDKITILHRRDTLSATHLLQEKIRNNPAIEIQYNQIVTEFHGDDHGIVAITTENTSTKLKKNVECDGVFLAIGLLPNTSLFLDQLELDQNGYIKTFDQIYTSVEGVFVAGDAQDSIAYRQAVVSAGFGCIAALQAEQFLNQILDSKKS